MHRASWFVKRWSAYLAQGKPGLLVILMLIFLAAAVHAQEEEQLRETRFTFGGYAKLDLVLSMFGNGLPDVANPVRDMYLPAAIPVGEKLREYDTQLHAKESRFNFEVKSYLLGKPVKGFVELDFLLSKAGDQRVSNSYNPRLRHFYFQWDKFLFGQTWTTFMTVDGIPDGIIFLPGGEGLVFVRQAQIRYSTGNWDFAMENPETTVLPPGEGQAFNITSGGMPDIIAKYNIRGDDMTIGFAAVYRLLLHEDNTSKRHAKSGYGISAGGVIHVNETDDFRFMLTYGSGLGRYLGFAFATAAALDESFDIHAIRSLNGVMSVTHHWSEKWSTSLHASFFSTNDNSKYTGGGANRYCWSGSISLMYEPHPSLLFGIHALYSRRELENGIGGDLRRIQFSAKYAFRYSDTIFNKTQ